MDDHRLNQIKAKVDAIKAEKIRAQQRLDSALDQLQSDYGYSTIDSARTAYNRTQKEIPVLKRKLEHLLSSTEALLDRIEYTDAR